jgi:hypothetical protein
MGLPFPLQIQTLNKEIKLEIAVRERNTDKKNLEGMEVLGKYNMQYFTQVFQHLLQHHFIYVSCTEMKILLYK